MKSDTMAVIISDIAVKVRYIETFACGKLVLDKKCMDAFMELCSSIDHQLWSVHETKSAPPVPPAPLLVLKFEFDDPDIPHPPRKNNRSPAYMTTTKVASCLNGIVYICTVCY